MHRLQRTMQIRYMLLMIILVIALISLRLSMENYNYIQGHKMYFETEDNYTVAVEENK